MLIFDKNQPGNKEGRTLKILFWCITPLLALAFFRLYWLVFGFIYGGLLFWIFGSQFTGIIAAVSIATALGFTILTVRYLYQQFNRHIIAK
jgi:hypothetical protein